MPELPEVETVRRTLKNKVLGKTIKDVNVFYDNLISYPDINTFKKEIINHRIKDILRLGKWLIFDLDDYCLLSHLRMEGKYFYKNIGADVTKHEHISFILDDMELRYNDTRKFGRMYLYAKDEVYEKPPLSKLGKEPWDLNVNYLKEKFCNKKLPIKTVLLDQSIITGIGNIYADEILFKSGVNPLKITNELSDKEIENIIANSKMILEEAINMKGTTIRSYTSSEGVSGLFQNNLLVHKRENLPCKICNTKIKRIKIGDRSTYFCPRCQQSNNV